MLQDFYFYVIMYENTHNYETHKFSIPNTTGKYRTDAFLTLIETRITPLEVLNLWMKKYFVHSNIIK